MNQTVTPFLVARLCTTVIIIILLGTTNVACTRTELIPRRDTPIMTVHPAAAAAPNVPRNHPAPSPRRIVYISLEYCQDDLFSGNGVCARSQVQGLSTLFSSSLEEEHHKGGGIIQEVIVARPLGVDGSIRPLSPLDCAASTTSNNNILHIVPVTIWKTTDRNFEHERFAKGVCDILSRLLTEDTAAARDTDDQRTTTTTSTTTTKLPPISAILAVDWTGMAGIHHVPLSLRANIPIFFLNFRVYTRMTNISRDDRAFYFKAEQQAVQLALTTGGAVMVISSSDLHALQDMVLEEPTKNEFSEHQGNGNSDDTNPLCQHNNNNSNQNNRKPFWKILPMLRNEFLDMALRDASTILDRTRHRPYFACIVRLSEDKGPQRFVETCIDITRRDPAFWSRTRTIPLLAGAASQPEFAHHLQMTFRTHVPEAMILDDFLDAEELARWLQDTRLNLHPALYEAFGMTIVEAAACGVPTVLSNQPGAIGAEELISIEKGCAYGVDLEDQEALTSKVMELLVSLPPNDCPNTDHSTATTGHRAYHAAITWTELDHCRMLWGMVLNHLKA